ncbi:hypothetical protein EDC96DRAFT_441258 [Choanephora cucurbitarum]|nr:hypothetical protein EDC96DRAFT_441258 [Choanephora cucurbitarum]
MQPPNNKKRQLTEAVESNRPTKQPFVPRIDCKYFIHGHCKDGDNCTFKHDPNAVQSKPTPAKPRIVCQFFKTNSCSKLGDCEFSHDLSIEPCRFHFLNGKCNSQTCSYSHAPLTDETRQMLRVLTGPCRFYYLKGFCNNGDLCNFSHSGCSEEERQRLEQEILPCKYFFSNGSCPKGDDCFYGHSELKNL